MAAPGVRLSGRRHPRRLDRFVLQVILLGGLVGVIVGVQLLVLLVLGRFPTGDERAVLAVSMIAAAVAALLYQPARSRLEQLAESLLPSESRPTGDVLTAFAGQLSRAVPLDQLLLELAESLRRGLRAGGGRGLDGVRRPVRADDGRSRSRLGEPLARCRGRVRGRRRRRLGPRLAWGVASGAAGGPRRSAAPSGAHGPSR